MGKNSGFYSLEEIKKAGAQYNMIIGERSNGKTYSVLMEILSNYVKTGKQGALIRRWQDDFVGKRGISMFNALDDNGEVSKLTKGEWTHVAYFASKWYLAQRTEDGKQVKDEKPFCYGFSLSGMEHDKSTSYPNITTVLFDEFLTRQMYIMDEFIIFMNVLSTIIRHRNDVTVYMLGNTVTKYCPYFNEMGLTHVKDMLPGKIDVYTYGDSKLKVAVEMCKSSDKGKKSDAYFAFDNPKLNMITKGMWELEIYPHCPVKYVPKEVIYTFYIVYDMVAHACDIVLKEDGTDPFIFIMPKTTELHDLPEDLIYNTDHSIKPNHRRNILKARTDLEKRIMYMFNFERVFYATNEVGEHIAQYIKWCERNR